MEKLKQLVENLKSTDEAYKLGVSLSKEEAIDVWKEYKKRLDTLHPEDLNEWGHKGFIDQMHRETVEGYIRGGKHTDYALSPKEIDERLK
jgi:hypothetical protein